MVNFSFPSGGYSNDLSGFGNYSMGVAVPQAPAAPAPPLPGSVIPASAYVPVNVAGPDTVRPQMRPDGLGAGTAAGAGAGQGWFGKMGGLDGISSLLQGLGSIGQIYGALQGVKLAKDQLNFSKEAYRTNLANTTKSYNTALEDRIRSRSVAENRPQGYADEYLKKHSM